MPVSSSAFIPTVNAITSSQDLQWMVQPTVITTTPSPRPRVHPYETLSPLSHARPGVIRSVGDARVRCRLDEQITPEEEEKRRLRRERNKMAAAKCRSRRKELTDWLQGETEKLEEEKAGLQKEIETLQLEREKLELVLISHKPICQLSDGQGPQENTVLALPTGHTSKPVVVKQEPSEDLYDQEVALSLCKQPQLSVIKPTSSKETATSLCSPEGNGFHTPTVATSTPPHSPSDPDEAFTYASLPEQDSTWPGPKAGCSPSMHQPSDSLCMPSLLPL